MHIKFQNSPLKGGTNAGSCGKLIDYLEKEDKNRADDNVLKGFFNSERNDLSNIEAKDEIEHKFFKKGLKTDADKFYTVTMSFSQDELIDRTDEELIEFAQQKFPELYCNAVQGKEFDINQLQWVAKLEENRKHKGTDEAVKEGTVKSGSLKDGDQRHIHFVVARKTKDGKRQISPMTNHFKPSTKTGVVKSGFDKYHMVFQAEQFFDRHFGLSRPKSYSVMSKVEIITHRPDLVEKFSEAIAAMREEPTPINVQFAKISQLQLADAMTDLEKELSAWNQFKELLNEKVIKPIQRQTRHFSTVIKKSSEDIVKTRIPNQDKNQKQNKNKNRGMGM